MFKTTQIVKVVLSRFNATGDNEVFSTKPFGVTLFGILSESDHTTGFC